ncbi:MAG: DeoR/GlpR family DNA-binding transcription regulator [Bryobacteraceae bacterium]|jgi:DeoR family transcriptional regulator of aga operon
MSRKEAMQERSQRILDRMFRDGTLSVQSIASQLGISVATVRRDMRRLSSEGRLKRIHGGAVPAQPLIYEAFRHDSSFQEQVEKHADEKRRIAVAAAELIQDGDTVGVTPGTTTTQVTRSIPNRSGVTIVTNAVNIAMELSKRSNLEVLVIGGFLREIWFSLVGPPAIQAVGHLILEKMFIGANGVDAKWGLTTFNADEAALNRAMIARAKQKIVVADHSKLGVAATYEFWPLDGIDILITDAGASDAAIAPFLAKNIEVRRV